MEEGKEPLKNPRHEQYCLARASGLSQRQAMLRAYPSRAGWRDAVVDNKACELEQTGEVKVRLAALMRESAERSAVTRAHVIDGLAETFDAARRMLTVGGDELGERRVSQAAITGISSIGRTLLDALPAEEAAPGAAPFRADFGLLLAEPFLRLHRRLASGEGLDAWIKGGRASTKSSAVSLEVVRLLMEHPAYCALVMVKRANSIRESVYQQVLWALSQLGVEGEWDCPASTLKMVNRRTGQVVLFKGGDDTSKTKAVTPPPGMYYAVLWVEECDQFAGMAELRRVYQSVTRNAPQGSQYYRFHTYNPPRARDSWANAEAERRLAAGEFVMHVNYEDVPPEWLTEQFRGDAEALREADEEAYRHEYLGEPVGYGAEVFPRAVVREVGDEERRGLDRHSYGVDWGFSSDPFVWLKVGYSARTRTLYVLDEHSGKGLSNAETAAEVSRRMSEGLRSADGRAVEDPEPYAKVWCDSAEPKSVADWRDLGVQAVGAPKQGAHSVRSGVRWLQERAAIVVDPRCRLAARELPSYCYALTPDGEPTGLLPDRDNHAIDALRYACTPFMDDRGAL